MHKKLMMACMAIAAFAAFVIAPAASASPVLTEPGVGTVAVGSIVKATNTGNTVFTATGGTTVTCDHVTLTGKVTKNSGTVIEGEMTTADFNGTGTETDCTSSLFGGSSVRVTVPKLCMKVSANPADEVVVTGCGKPVEFTFHFTGLNTSCTYTRSEIRAKFTTGASPVTVTNTEETKLSSGGFLCPSGGFLDMTFDVWTEVEGVESGPELVIS